MTQPRVNDYGGFGAILDEAGAIEDELRQRDRADCPQCGTLLDVRSDGAVNCPLGHYRRSAPEKVLP